MTPAFHLVCTECGAEFGASIRHEDPRCQQHRWCIAPGCRALVRTHGGRCPVHQSHAARPAPVADPAATTRRCPDCGGIMSRWNRGDRCHVCEAARAVARLRGAG